MVIDSQPTSRLGIPLAITLSIWLTAILLLPLTISGCSTFSQHRNKVENRWNEVRARTKYQLASQQFERGQLETAVATAKESIATDATSSHPFLLLARCLVEQGKFVSAREAAELASVRAPASAEIEYTLGVIAERTDQMETALQHFRRAGSLDPTVADYLVAEAECLTATGHSQEAAELIAVNINRLDSDGTLEFLLAEISLLHGDHGNALLNLRKAFKRSGLAPGQVDESFRARMLVEQYGRMLSEAGRHKEAVAVIGPHVRAVTDAPASVVTALCASYLATGRVDEATQLLRREVRRNPANSKGWMLLARAAMMVEDWTTARQCAEKLANLEPDDGLAPLLLGFVSWKRNDLQAAEDSLRRALELDDDAMTHDVFARVLSDAGRPRATVEAHFERAQQLDPRFGRAMSTWNPLASTDPAAIDESSQQASPVSLNDGTKP